MIFPCLFCAIITGQVAAQVVWTDEHALAFLDVSPRAPGHTIVIPRVHSPTLATLPLAEVPPLFIGVQKVAALLSRALTADGLTIGINQGTVSGQSVDHLHVHILPRFQGDGGGSIHSVVNNPPVVSLTAMVERIRSIQ